MSECLIVVVYSIETLVLIHFDFLPVTSWCFMVYKERGRFYSLTKYLVKVEIEVTSVGRGMYSK